MVAAGLTLAPASWGQSSRSSGMPGIAGGQVVRPGEATTIDGIMIRNCGKVGDIMVTTLQGRQGQRSRHIIAMEQGACSDISGLQGCGDAVDVNGGTAMLNGSGYKVSISGDRGMHTLNGDDVKMDIKNGGSNNGIIMNGAASELNNRSGNRNMVIVNGNDNHAGLDRSGNTVTMNGNNNVVGHDAVETSC